MATLWPDQFDASHALSRIETALNDLKSGQNRLFDAIQQTDIKAPMRMASDRSQLAVPTQSGSPNMAYATGKTAADSGAPVSSAQWSATTRTPITSSLQAPSIMVQMGSENDSIVAVGSECDSPMHQDSTQKVSGVGSGQYVAVSLPVNWPVQCQLHEELRMLGQTVTTQDLGARLSMCPVQPLASPKAKKYTSDDLDSALSKKRRCVIHPESKLHGTMDSIATLFVLYELLVTPYCVAWDVEANRWLEVQYVVSIGFWIIDLCASFFTGFYTQGRVELSLSAIRRHYLRGWFIVDVSLILCDVANLSATVLGMEGGRHFLRILRLSRLFRAVTFAKVWRLFLRLEDFFESSHAESVGLLLKLVRIAIAVLGTNHLIACFWMLIGRSASTSNGRRWVDEVAWHEEDVPITYEQTDRTYQYMVTFHWALAQITLGSSAVNATNWMEQAFAVLCLIFGLLMGTSLISMFSAEMVEAQFSDRQKDMVSKQLRRFLRRERIEHRFSRMIRAMAQHRLDQSPPLAESEIQCLRLLPAQMQMELHFELCGPCLLGHPLFCLFYSFSFTTMLRTCMDAVTVSHVRENDEVFTAGDVGEKTYMLKSGMGTYRQEPESAPVLLAYSTKVDKGRWLAEAALWVQWLHVGTWTLTEQSEIISINAKAFIAGLLQHVIFQDFLASYSQMFQQRLMQAQPPKRRYPNDLAIPGTAFEDIIFAMDSGLQEAIAQQAVRVLGASTTQNPRPRLNFTHSAVDLAREHREGGLVFLISKDRGKCVNFRTVVRIQQEHSELMLMHAGRFSSDNKLSILAEMPSTKQARGEAAESALSRIIQERLAVAASDLEHLPKHKMTSRGGPGSSLVSGTAWGSRSTGSQSVCQSSTVVTTYLMEVKSTFLADRLVDVPADVCEVTHMFSLASVASVFKRTVSNVWPPGFTSVGRSSKESLRRSPAACASENQMPPSFTSSVTFLRQNPVFAAKNVLESGEMVYDLFMWVDEEDLQIFQTTSGKSALHSHLSRLQLDDIEFATGQDNSGASTPTLKGRLEAARQTAKNSSSFESPNFGQEASNGSVLQRAVSSDTEKSSEVFVAPYSEVGPQLSLPVSIPEGEEVRRQSSRRYAHMVSC